MRLKLDENLGTRGQDILAGAGHDVATVAGQELTSTSDTTLIEICRKEQRALITLDLDFANTLVFPPDRYAGIAVLRLSNRPTQALLLELITTLAEAMKANELFGHLWIVERDRIRIHQSR